MHNGKTHFFSDFEERNHERFERLFAGDGFEVVGVDVDFGDVDVVHSHLLGALRNGAFLKLPIDARKRRTTVAHGGRGAGVGLNPGSDEVFVAHTCTVKIIS